MTTATDLARNLALAWWQPVLIVAVVYFGPRLIVKALSALDFRHTFDDLGSPEAWGIDDLLDGDTWVARQGLVQTEMTWTREALERVLAALDETAETFSYDLPDGCEPDHRTPIAEAVDFAMWQREVEA